MKGLNIKANKFTNCMSILHSIYMPTISICSYVATKDISQV